jgi:pyruvyltransferase
MTRAALLNSGIECPEVYGDPALLLPRFHNRGVEKKYSLGVVPHYVDKNHPWVRAARRRGVHIIDVQQENPLDVVDDIRRCRAIASSSLHGLVVADAYGIPSAQLVLTGRVWGGQFKFNDYFLSVGRPRHQPLRVSQWTTLAAVKTRAEKGPEISIDLDVLLAAAPFGGPHA